MERTTLREQFFPETLWRLHHAEHIAICQMWPHEFGWALRLVVVPTVTVLMSRVCRTVDEVLEMRESWKATLIHNGWRDGKLN